VKAVRPEASDGNEDKETVQGHEPRFRALFELSPDGIIILDLKGRILNVNKSFLDLSGYEREDFVGKHFSRIPSRLPMDLENYKSFFKAVLHRDLTDLEFNWRHKSGTIIRGLARIKVMREGTESPFVMAVIRDIGPRREKSAGIFVQRNFFETILEKLNEGIWVSNRQDEIVFANPAMERISGLPREEILGKNVLHDFPRETIEKFSD